jgi:hypothetical protein
MGLQVARSGNEHILTGAADGAGGTGQRIPCPFDYEEFLARDAPGMQPDSPKDGGDAGNGSRSLTICTR